MNNIDDKDTPVFEYVCPPKDTDFTIPCLIIVFLSIDPKNYTFGFVASKKLGWQVLSPDPLSKFNEEEVQVKHLSLLAFTEHVAQEEWQNLSNWHVFDTI